MATLSTTAPVATHESLWKLLFPLMTAEIVGALELSMIYAAMRSLIADFGSASSAGWLVTSFMLSSAAGAAMFGRIGDLLGRRRVLLFVLALAAAGSLLSAVVRELPWVITGRAMQGAAGAIIPLCYGIARERCEPSRLPFAIGMLAACSSIASAAGLLIGGIIIDFSDWTMIFKVTAALGALSFLCVLLMVSRDSQWDPHIMRQDLLGGLLFIPAAVSLLLAIDNIGHVGLNDGMTWIYGALAVLSLVVWLWRELTVENPLIEVRLLGTRAIGMGNALYIALALGAFQGGQIMALFGQQDPETGAGLGLSATLAGFLLLPANLITAACYPLIASICNSHGPRITAVGGFVLIILGFGSLTFWNDSYPVVMALLILQAVGLGAVYVTIPLVVVSASPFDRVSESTGMMTVIRATAMAIGAQTVATLLSTSGRHGGGPAVFPDEGDYVKVFIFVIGTAVAGLVFTWFLPARLAIRH